MIATRVFRLGSVTKQFTAAAIMLLVDAGKVSLQDDLRKWIPQSKLGRRSKGVAFF